MDEACAILVGWLQLSANPGRSDGVSCSVKMHKQRERQEKWSWEKYPDWVCVRAQCVGRSKERRSLQFRNVRVREVLKPDQ